MNYQFVSNITFKTDSYKGTQEYTTPIKFDNNRYNYFIKLLNVRFSNNIPNITERLTLSIDGTQQQGAMIEPGIYEIEEILEKVNTAIETQNIKFEVDQTNGKMIAINESAQNHTLSGSLIQSIQFGQFASSITVPTSASISSPSVCSVSDFNFIKLASNIVNPTSYETRGDKLVPSNTIYTFSAAIPKFGFKDFTAFQDIVYPLSNDQLTRIDFLLTDENGRELSLLDGAKSDFSVQAVIVKQLKSIR